MANDGLNKSAILLMSLGEDEAAEVFKHLGPREVQKIGAAMASMKAVSRDEIKAVVGEFCSQADEQSGMGMPSGDYIRNVLKKALGDDRSANLIDRILQAGDTSTRRSSRPSWFTSSASRPPRSSGSSRTARGTTCCCASPRSTAYSRRPCAS
jgi:flagellar motor switch protein FliG